MNQNYFKLAIAGILIIESSLASSQALAQQTNKRPKDRVDLVDNIRKVNLDRKKIAALRAQVKESREVHDRKAVAVHRGKLKKEKHILKSDLERARAENKSYIDRKERKISSLELKLKTSDAHYEGLRKKIRKDLSGRNDFALQEHAGDLLKAVQVRNDTYTELSMEKSDLNTTRELIHREWKKCRDGTGAVNDNADKLTISQSH